MSTLKTYTRATEGPHVGEGPYLPWPIVLAEGCGDPSCGVLAPGEWVTHKTWGGFGIIVAMDDENLSVLWSEEPRGDFSSIALPLVRRVFAPLIAQQLVSIQPMTAPVGGVFYMDYKYGDPFDIRCNEGPWWRKMFWRSWRWASTKTRTCWSSLRSWWASRSTKKSTRSENVDYEKQLLQKLATDETFLRRLAAPTRFGKTEEASEEDRPCP